MNLNERILGTIKLIVILMIGGFLGERVWLGGKPVQSILVCLVCGILVAEVDKLNVLTFLRCFRALLLIFLCEYYHWE